MLIMHNHPCKYLPLLLLDSGLLVTAGESIALNNFFQDASVSTHSHSPNMSLQHCFTFLLSTYISFSLALGKPNSIPISLHSVA